MCAEQRAWIVTRIADTCGSRGVSRPIVVFTKVDQGPAVREVHALKSSSETLLFKKATMVQVSWSSIGGRVAAEIRHAGHFDAILDYPEQFLGPQLIDDFLEVGRRVQPVGELGRFHAGVAVTIGAATLGE